MSSSSLEELKELIALTFLEEALTVSGYVESMRSEDSEMTLQVSFDPLNLEQQRSLIQLLYCRPGQWTSRCSPGELKSLGILARTLLQPRILLQRMATATVIRLAKP
jgi:cellulose synthase (UDP-forming)